MKTYLMILAILLSLFSDKGYSQIFSRGNHSFERICWGQSFEKTSLILAGFKLKEIAQSSGGLFSKSESNAKSFIFDDTLFGQKMKVTLRFDKESMKLISMMVGYMWFDKNKWSKEGPVVWQRLKEHYSAPEKEKDVQSYGTAMKWRIDKTEIMAMKMISTAYAIMLFFNPAES
ncbi:MAG: hypothetical protein NTV54_11900 [Ignavibacteriales bacterium]|nr:hypothetical protein [Ignavibacteriales bacterium]